MKINLELSGASLQRFVDKARLEALKSAFYHRMGAVLVKKNRIISFGHNKPHKSHPKSLTSYQRVHAEFDCIWRAPEEKISGSTIYVCRITEGGAEGLAKPCPDCQKLLKKRGVKKVIYSTGNLANPYAEEYL